MAGRFNHTEGCQTCGAHPDNPRNKTQKLWGCRDCKSFTCSRHLAKPRACPRCQSKRLYVAARFHAQNMKNKGSAGDTPKKGLFGSGGGGGANNGPNNAERSQKAGKVATEIVKGIGSGVAEAMKILSEKDARKTLARPEDGVTTEELHNSSVMAKNGDNLAKNNDTPSPEIGLVVAEDPLMRLTILAENTLDNESFLSIPNKKPAYTVDSYIFAPSLYEAEKISQELQEFNATHEQKMLCVVALHVDPRAPEVGEKFNHIVQANPYLFGSIGISPKIISDIDLDAADAHLSDVLNAQEKLIAVGPSGYDLHFNPHTAKVQGALLALHAEIATDFGLPLFLEHKNAAVQLVEFTQSTEQPLILTQAVPEIGPKPHIKQLLTVDIQHEDNKTKYSQVLTKFSKAQLLMGSGQRLQAVAGQARNTPELTLATLRKYCAIISESKHYSAQHRFNGNFLKAFHPDL